MRKLMCMSVCERKGEERGGTESRGQRPVEEDREHKHTARNRQRDTGR